MGNHCLFNNGTAPPVWSLSALSRPTRTAALYDGYLMPNASLNTPIAAPRKPPRPGSRPTT